MTLIDLLQMLAYRRIKRAINSAPNSTVRHRVAVHPRNNNTVSLGATPDGTDLTIPLDALVGHALILGATGAGKTSAAYVLITALVERWQTNE